MLKLAAVASLLAVPLFATSAHADNVTTEADTLVVVTPNAPVIVQQGGPQSVAPPLQPPGAAEMPPPPPPPPGKGKEKGSEETKRLVEFSP